jgi:hypothetical protein
MVERVPSEERSDQDVQEQLPPLEQPVAVAGLVGDHLVVVFADPGDAVVHLPLVGFRPGRAG